MDCNDVMKRCREAARTRHPSCEVEGDIERASADTIRPAWLVGCVASGWVATINVHGKGRVIVRHEAWGATKGWASGNLARAMGVALPDGEP